MAKPSRALLQAQARVKELDELLQQRDRDAAHLDGQVQFTLTKLQERTAENDQLRQANGELEQAAGVSSAHLKHCTTERDRYYSERETFRLEAREANKARDEAEADNVRLRDSLHSLTVTNARLEGQLERVHEFDPVTEQRQYRDGQRALDMRPMSQRVMELHPQAYDGGSPDRWYRRG